MPVQKSRKKSLKSSSSSSRHNPISKDKKKKNEIKKHQKSTKNDHLISQEEVLTVDNKTSQKILQLAREQQDELNEIDELNNANIINDIKNQKKSSQIILEQSDDDDDDDDDDQYHFDNDDYEQFDYDSFSAQLGVDKGDEAILEKFMNKEKPKNQLTLADMILEKIKAAESNQTSQMDDDDENGQHSALEKSELNPKIIDVYTKVGMILSRYKSGKLPKTFKIIPTFSNWEEILVITNPETWTPHATYEATRLFSSNLKSNLAQRFYFEFLLPKIRYDILETKKLNIHLYNALKKALYKPAAFFKGFLLPLISDDCSLREAIIIGSVLTKVSIPSLHSAACLIKLAELSRYSGANSIFIRILLDKKYALPYKVLDVLVFHFLRIKNVIEDVPVLWHQSLLVFAQRYKMDITDEQKDSLLELIKIKNHYLISPEISRELTASA
jgi:essential nuclear protein 1